MQDWFGINERGELYAKNKLDREIVEFIQLTVFAEDLNADKNFKPQISSSKNFFFNLKILLEVFNEFFSHC